MTELTPRKIVKTVYVWCERNKYHGRITLEVCKNRKCKRRKKCAEYQKEA